MSPSHTLSIFTTIKIKEIRNFNILTSVGGFMIQRQFYDTHLICKSDLDKNTSCLKAEEFRSV